MNLVQQIKVRITRSDGFRIPMGNRTIRTFEGMEVFVPLAVAGMLAERGTAEIVGESVIRHAALRKAARPSKS